MTVVVTLRLLHKLGIERIWTPMQVMCHTSHLVSHLVIDLKRQRAITSIEFELTISCLRDSASIRYEL